MKQRNIFRNLLLAGTTIILFATACSKDNNDSNSTMARLSNRESDYFTVYISNMTFSPQDMRTSPTRTVTWINNDNVVHTVTADDGSFNSGDILPKGTYSHTFSAVNTYTYHCNYHPEMTGRVTVVGNK